MRKSGIVFSSVVFPQIKEAQIIHKRVEVKREDENYSQI